MRGTLHLVPAEELPLYVGALDNRGEYQSAWLRAFDVTAAEMERLIRAIADALDGSCLTREELVQALRPRIGERLTERLASGWGTLLKPAARCGVLCFGPSRGQNVTFVRPDQWLAGWTTPPGRTEARTELLRRFLAAYGPATTSDFEHWLGVNRRVKEEWDVLREELVEVAPKTFLLAADREEFARTRAGRGVRLLPMFDPFVLFPRSSRPVPEDMRPLVYREAAWISATVLHGDRVVGVWPHRLRSRALSLQVQPFATLARQVRAAVEREAERLAAYLGRTLDFSIAS